MSDAPKGAGSALTAASGSLRDTSKWLVGGVVATAASVFAGSSLTSLGSLSIPDDTARLAAALIGAVIGFVALAMVMQRAIAVLTVESVTFRQLADAEASTAPEDALFHRTAKKVAVKYRPSMPTTITTLAAYVAEVDVQRDIVPPTPASATFLADARAFNDLVMPDAGFLSVRDRFGQLTVILPKATAVAIAGFGLFAWAANPPADRHKPPETPRLVNVRIIGSAPPTQLGYNMAAPPAK